MTFTVETYRAAANEFQQIHDERKNNPAYKAYKEAIINYCKTFKRPKIQIAVKNGDPAQKLDRIMRKIALRAGFIVESIDVEFLTMRSPEQLDLSMKYEAMKADMLYLRYRESKKRLKELAFAGYRQEKQNSLSFEESPAASQKYRMWSASFLLQQN